MPKVGIQLLLIRYLLPESFVLASARILLLLFVAVAIANPFDPNSPLNFQYFYHSGLLAFYRAKLAIITII